MASTGAVLVTGMSGVGKSTALAALGRRGFDVVDTDEPGWTHWSDSDGGYVWDEQRIGALLSTERSTTLFISGTVSNQGLFYPRFDAVVLLAAPVDVLLRRIEARTTNEYGKHPAERDDVLRNVATVEPLLRATCTHEIDATLPVNDVVRQLMAIATDPTLPFTTSA